MPVVVAGDNSPDLADVVKMLTQQQAQLDAQKQFLTDQQKLINKLQAEQTESKADYEQKIADQQVVIDEQRQSMRAMQTQIDTLSDFDPSEMTEEEKEFRSRLQTLEESIAESTDASSTSFDADSFPGSLPIPGSAAAIRIGGFVKANYIQSFNSIGSKDRFIVGSIPTDPEAQGDAQAELTVSQSRLSFDLRDNTDVGVLRAFIEGDFAGDGDTFRLRHAYGQAADFLAGKTWSVFADVEASPEEIDFEGINGRVLVRQTQFRWFPKIGRDSNLIVSLEDPQPDIANGESTSLIPDTIASIRRNLFGNWHVKSALLVRSIEGRWTCNATVNPLCVNEKKDSVFAWGLTVSGKVPFTKWDPRDNILFQVNLGKGMGGYTTDLSSVGGGDAQFDPTGNLYALPVLAGYVAFQKWWQESLRSTFIVSTVNIDNYSWQGPGSYNRTQRTSGNLIWSPTVRVDLGGELIWGRREDKDEADGTALQLQLSAKYRF